MPTLNVNVTLSYGTTEPNGAVMRREPYNFVLDYTEESSKLVHVPAGSTDFVIKLDSVDNPKFLFARAELADVIVKLSDGVTTDPTVSALSSEMGWMMFVHPVGQPIKEMHVTTPSSPLSGARVRIIAFE